MSELTPEAATKVLSEVFPEGLTQDFVDPRLIVKHINLKLLEDGDLPDDVVGEIVCGKEGVVIKINPRNNYYEPRRNFTIAHELGHYFMHLNDSCEEFVDNRKTMNRTTSFWDKKESEANDFAANLLMPVSLIVRNGKRIIDDYKKENNASPMPQKEFVIQLSNVLKVSRESLGFRLKNLGIIK
jgi:Zn-dependent peptidase ImmA (M78 family)